MNVWEEFKKALKQAIDSFCDTLQDVLEYINSKIHPKQHFPNPPKKLIPNYTEPFRTIRRIARSDC